MSDEPEIRTLSGYDLWGQQWDSIATSNAAKIPVTPENSLKVAALLACVRLKSETLASLPWHVYERLPGGGKQIADIPLNTVLTRSPNSWQSSFEFRELMHSWVLLWGAAFALIKPGARGAVSELIPLHPSRMTVRRLANMRLRYIYSDPNGGQKTYRQDQIFAIRYLTQDGVSWYTPTTLSQETIALARAAEIHTGAFFGNGAKPGTILESANMLKPDVMNSLRRQWDSIHQGAGSSNKTAILPHGITMKTMAPESNTSAQLLETRRFSVEEIARAYRVPPSMIGVDGSSYNSLEQQSRDFVTYSLTPDLHRWDGAATRDLIDDDDRYFTEFDTAGLLRAYAQARSQYIRELWGMGVLSINEIRDMEGMNPLDGDEGEKRFVQTSYALLQGFTDDNPTGQNPQSVEEIIVEDVPADTEVVEEDKIETTPPEDTEQ
jgi:HK97 family phage portal protein